MASKLKIEMPQIFVSPKEYKIDGKSYFRVTSTLGVLAKHSLLNWIGKVGYVKANKILETRQAIGTHVHKLIEDKLSGKAINLSTYEKEIQDGLIKFEEFRKLAKLKPEFLEQNLWSNKYGYAGTADFIGYYKTPVEYLAARIINHKRQKIPKFENKSLVIGDWKTGKDIYQEYWLQISAYAHALKEMTGVRIKGAFIARIRDGKIQVKEKTMKELEEIFPVYLAVLEAYQWKYKVGKYAFLKKR